MSRALVLGGGGLTGIAWETGVLVGLAESGIDVTGWDAVIGTSAGAVVGARLLADGSPTLLYDVLMADDPAARRRQIEAVVGRMPIILAQASSRRGLGWLDATGVLAVMARSVIRTRDPRAVGAVPAILRSRAGGADPAAALRAWARLARTVPTPPSEWIAAWSDLLRSVPGWPAGLVVTAVDIDARARVAFDASSGVALPTAIAASTAIGGLLPPIPAGAGTCLDGGTVSTTNADLARDHDEVMVVAPIVRGSLDPELPRQGRAAAMIVTPSKAADALLGRALGRLDPDRIAVAVAAGREDGRRWGLRRLSPSASTGPSS